VAVANVIPSQRTSKSGENQLIYFQGSDVLELIADKDGQVQLSGFQAGDEARVYVRSPQGEWEEQSFRVPEDGVAAVTMSYTGMLPADRSDDAALLDLKGRVLDHQGQPIANARVLLILKTWPGNRYQQRDFNTNTDEEGRYKFEGLIPANARYAVLVAALADGHALQSKYELHKQPDGERNEIDLKLETGAPVTIQLKGADGQGVAGIGVVPSSRQQAGEPEQFVYFQGSEVLRLDTNKDGQVLLHGFRSGDDAAVYVKQPGGEWVEKKFRVPADGSAVEIAP
jgi:hypothetical protein